MTELRQRRPRQLNPHYLAWLRTMPCCCGCRSPSPSDAAHIRSASLKNDKPHTGMAQKPDDRWAVPLKHAHHMAQHAHGDELGWFAAHGIKDVFTLALRYNALYGKETGKWAHEHHEPRPRPRKAKSKAKKPKRKTKWASRKIQSRGFSKECR